MPKRIFAMLRCAMAAAVVFVCQAPALAQRPLPVWSPSYLHPAVAPMSSGLVLMGGGRIGELELTYLLGAMEQKQGVDARPNVGLADDLWRLMIRIPSD